MSDEEVLAFAPAKPAATPSRWRQRSLTPDEARDRGRTLPIRLGKRSGDGRYRPEAALCPIWACWCRRKITGARARNAPERPIKRQ